MKPLRRIDLYKLWQQHWQRGEWDGAAQSANCILHSVDAKYRKKRYEIIWTGESSLPSFRYPYPYPVHNAAWEASYQEYEGKDGHVSRVPVVSVPLGGQRWMLRLAGGADRIRQLRSFAKIVNGEAIHGELAIYRQRTFGGGNGVTESNGAAGQQVRTRIMVKMVAWLPRNGEEREQKGTLNVCTTNNSFLVALMDGDERPWRLHADDVRGVIKAHEKRLQRLSDDTKSEKRRPPRQKARYNEMLSRICERRNNRVDSFIKEAASWLVNYAVRRKAECVAYSDKSRGYFPSFPWEQFRSQVAQKCDDTGIEFAYTYASGEEVNADDAE